MLERFREVLEGLPCPKDGAVLLAVSGGVDSMVMADLFRRCGTPVRVLHCNFSLRGSDSDADEALVREWCREQAIPFESVRFDTADDAARRGVSLEMAARDLRYGWFARRSAACGNAPVAVAHHADDDAETLLLNLLRGTGVEGLRGMRPVRPLPDAGPLIRPLLGFSRADIAAYAAEQAVPFREDATNADTRFKRNLVRHEILPAFDRINPSWRSVFARNRDHFAEAARILDAYVRDHVPSAEGDRVEWGLDALRAEPERRYLLYRFLRDRGFPASVPEQVDAMLQAGRPTAGFLYRGATRTLTLTSSTLILEAAPADGRGNGPEGPWILPGPGRYDCGGTAVVVSLEPVPADLSALRCPEGVSVFDAGTVSFPLTLRRWQAGDWLRPMGLGGRKKLSDLFTDLHFDRLRKEKALVLADEGSHVFSLLGYRTDEDARVTSRTRQMLTVRIQ